MWCHLTTHQVQSTALTISRRTNSGRRLRRRHCWRNRSWSSLSRNRHRRRRPSGSRGCRMALALGQPGSRGSEPSRNWSILRTCRRISSGRIWSGICLPFVIAIRARHGRYRQDYAEQNWQKPYEDAYRQLQYILTGADNVESPRKVSCIMMSFVRLTHYLRGNK